ncbi:hypothetical protein BC829DRAFT_194638 [Chytridium lagenaria]|nr:hypothetical protein BC829DRAFT_194638 [Chytridium lagenaria]
MFPSDFETDRSGAIVKINSSMSIFILRALARAAAGVAISLLPFYRRRTTLRRSRLVPRTRSSEALMESREKPLLTIVPSDAPVTPGVKKSLLSVPCPVPGSYTTAPPTATVLPKFHVTSPSKTDSLEASSRASLSMEIPIPRQMTVILTWLTPL